MRKLLLVWLLSALVVPSLAQFGSNTARRINSGTAAPPATCSSSPVDAYVRTGATLPGLYLCQSANTWSGPLSTSGGTFTGDVYFKSGRPWIDVRAYGAVGDNVTNDTAAFQSAFTAWKSAGTAVTLYIPPGNYLITTSIDATNNTYGGVVEGAGLSSNISCRLSAGNPCLDFTGTEFVVVRDIQITGSASGQQSAAVLNARSQSNNFGDFPFIENVLVQGTYAVAALANISADQGTYFRDILSLVSAPVGLFLGCTDVLGVTSAYATFASVLGCTQYHVSDTSFSVPTPTTTANISSISQSGTTLTITVPAASPVFQHGSFTLSGTLSTTASTLTVLTSTQGIISGTTSAAHGLVVGDRAVIAGVTPSALNTTCTIATVPTTTTFTCNAGNGLSDTTGTVFGTVTRSWDEDYIAATVSGSTITATMQTTVADTGSAAGTIESSGEAIRLDGVGALLVESSYFGMAGNMTAGIRMSNFQATVATNVKLLNVRQENNSNVPFTHVVDSYYTGMHSANVDANITTLGSLFRLGVGRTISGSTFKIIALGSSTQLLFDGGGNVSQTSVVDDSTTSYSFNIGSGSGRNYFYHPTGKTKQFVGNSSIVEDGAGIWFSGTNMSFCLYDSESCSNSGRINLPNSTSIYERNGAGTANIPLIGMDSNNNLSISGGTAGDTYLQVGNFKFGTDNSKDIGASGANRPRDLYLARDLRITGLVKNDGATSTMGLTRKAGTGAGNYTSASTTVTAVDGTNLTFTVTIPTGWKLGIEASGSVTTATAVATATVQLYDGTCNTGTALQAIQSVPTAATNPESWALTDVVTGDGASHTINLCYATSAGADSVTMINSSAALSPRMVFHLLPSN